MTAPVHRTEVDGVPVFWSDLPGRLHAELLFAVGAADETFATAGVTHLLEHLLMRQLGEFDHEANACTALQVTAFEVSSRPAVVVEHLARLCAAVREPDLGPIDVERRVLVAEDGHSGISPLLSFPLVVRFGNRGAGLAGVPEFGPPVLPADVVLAWHRRMLHRGNAALALTGPPPAGLRLALPDGPPVLRADPPPLPLPTPAWTTGPEGVVTAAFHGRWSAELAAGLNVLGRRLTARLRHEAGVTYHVHVESVQLRSGTTAVVAPEVGDDQVWTAATALLDELDALCADGPSETELARDRAMLQEGLEDPDVERSAPADAAAVHLLGVDSDHEHHRRTLAGLDPGAVAAALRVARDSLVLGVPPGHALHRLPELPLPAGPTVTGRVLPRRLVGSSTPRGSELTLGADGLAMRIGRGTDAIGLTVPFADVVGVVVDGDDHAIVAAGGGEMLLRAADWKDGASAVAALRAAVAPVLFVRAP